jgi:energy-converting hydrogenase Eha subunit A
MDAQAPPTGSRGRTIAFRVVAGIFGAIVVISNIVFTVPVFTDESEKVHSFHVLGVFPMSTLLIGFPLIVLAIRPNDVVALRVAWAAVIGAVIASLIGEDVVAGSYFIAPVVLIVLTVLAPTRRELVRLGSPNIAMLCLALVAAIPAIVYAWDNARMMLQGDPMNDPTGHWKFHHWSGIGGAALGLVLAAAVVAFRDEQDRMWTWLVGLCVMLFGVVGIIYANDARYPSSIGTWWGVVTLFVGIAYIVVAEVSARSEASEP